MFFCPFYRTPEKSFVRILHASPDAPPVDVYLNDKIIARNLSYKQFTPYVSVAPGLYNLRIYPAGRITNPLINTNYNFKPDTIVTLAAGSQLSNIRLFSYEEPKLPSIPGSSYVRFIHLSPNTPASDLTNQTGKVIARNISFGGSSNYTPLASGTYTLEVSPTGTNSVALHVPNVIIRPGRFYSVYLVGFPNEIGPLQVLLPLDGNSYIEF